MQRYLQRITGMFLRLPRMDSAFFHSVFCSQDAIFFHLLYSREQRAKGACLHAHLATVAGALTYGIIERKSIITVFLLVLPEFLEVTGVWLAVPLAEFFTLMLTVALLVAYKSAR